MKKIIASLLAFTLLVSGCSNKSPNITNTEENTTTPSVQLYTDDQIKTMEYSRLDDDDLIRFVEDNVYANVINTIDNDKYYVQNVEATYISKEYIEELEFNSRENIYFGYNLRTLEEQFQGQKYVFTLGDNNQTVVKAFEGYDDTYEKALKNIAIGTGVILVCVTVSVATAGTAPAVSLIFAASAKTGAVMALESGAIGAVTSGVVTAIESDGDVDAVMKAAALGGSEGFKWGAIGGAVAGGAGEAYALKGATLNGLSMNEAALIQKESGYPLDIIKQFKSMEEYNVYKDAGLTTKMVDGKLALVQDIDLNFKSPLPKPNDNVIATNLERMQKGLAPIDPATGEAFQLHHINQEIDGTLAILNPTQHQGNASILNEAGKIGVHNESQLSDSAWRAIRKSFWQDFAANI